MSSVFAIDSIVADVQAEFTAKGIAAELLVGEWETFRNQENARVIFGLGAGAFEPVGFSTGDHYAQGANFPTSDTTMARPLWRCLQTIKVWVVFPQNEAVDDDRKSIVARQGAWDLLNQTMRAMWHSHGGAFPTKNLVWINEAQADRTYGSAVSFESVFAVPVLDDDFSFGTADTYDTDLVVVNPDGTEVDQGTSTGP